jgi:AraC-like DNA-binding protein
MGFIRRITQRPLADFVDLLWLSEGYLQPHRAERVLPTGCMDLVIDLDESTPHRGVVSGAQSQSIILSTVKPLSLIGARFKPGGGFPFFGVPAGALQDLSVPLDTLWGARAETLRARLLEAATPRQKFLVLEAALLDQLQRGACRHPAVLYATRTFQLDTGSVNVADIVDRTGFSARKLIALFRDEVGLPPKVFSRICRFRRVLRHIEGATEIDWVDTALACGYFDQAHFVHDFRALVGVTPTAYTRHRTSNLNHVRVPDP